MGQCGEVVLGAGKCYAVMLLDSSYVDLMIAGQLDEQVSDPGSLTLVVW